MLKDAPAAEMLAAIRVTVEVLRPVARGATNPEIAESLYVSERTVKGHISGIFTKLGVRDLAAAIICAYDAGLVNPGR